MGRKLQSRDCPGTIPFLARKVSLIYPAFFVSTLLAFVLRMVALPHARLADWGRAFLLAIPELSLLQMAGLKVGQSYNGVTWYISAMILAMFVLYPLFCRFRSYFSSIGSLTLALVCYSAISQKFGTLNGVAPQWCGFCTYGILRATAGLSLGVFLNDCVQRTKGLSVESAAGLLFVKLLKFSLLAFILLTMVNATKWKLPKSADFVLVGFFFVFLLLVLSGIGRNRIFQSRVFRWCGPASLYLYLNHRGTLWFLTQKMPNAPFRQAIVIYAVGTLLSMLVCLLGASLLRRGFRFINRRCSQAKDSMLASASPPTATTSSTA